MTMRGHDDSCQPPRDGSFGLVRHKRAQATHGGENRTKGYADRRAERVANVLFRHVRSEEVRAVQQAHAKAMRQSGRCAARDRQPRRLSHDSSLGYGKVKFGRRYTHATHMRAQRPELLHKALVPSVNMVDV